MPFVNRVEAGGVLAERLEHRRGQDVAVLGLPRGGVPVAFEVARGLGAPLDVVVVRKLGVPFQPELAMGAIGEGGVRILNRALVRDAQVSDEELAAVESREQAILEQRIRRLRGDRERVPLQGRTAIIVDDGIATGSTARAACQVARALGASRVVVAVPVASPSSVTELRTVADEVVSVETPERLGAIGQFYEDFSPTSDEQVVDLLERSAAGTAATAPPSPSAAATDPPLRDEDVDIPAGGVRLLGHLMVPERPVGTVVFVHGSGSSRHSPRNRFVAAKLNRARLATLLFDLLSPDEEVDRAKVFDIGLLAGRLTEVTGWLRGQEETVRLPLGYFGASTGAAAALSAAAEPGADVTAVVSRGGRPDLAEAHLADVHTPVLLIVGEKDDVVLALNEQAKSRLAGEVRVAVVPAATHLFEEPGALERVAELASQWFVRHLASQPHEAG